MRWSLISTCIRILDANRRPTAILDNVYDTGYERPANGLWKAFFSLPLDDAKNSHCKPFNYVELTDIDGTYIGLFRIIPAKTRKLASINEIQYECEHVLATLLNDVLFRYHQRSNFTTRENIEYILTQQTSKNWRLGKCDFERYFHYKWENENGLLGALFSIAEPFDEPYVWTWDTRSYPWTLNLVKPETKPTAEVRFGKNLAEIEREVDPSNIVNRLYPLGYGEGVNQLDITKVNNNVPYIEDTASINEYGLQSYVWVDRRFEDENSLLASARKFLAEWSIPKVVYRIKAVDLSSLTGLSIDKLTVGKLIRVVDPELGTFNARIVNERKTDIIGAPYDIELEISNKADGIGTSLADIERRQEINEVYAQGATNIMTFGYQDNADSSLPAVIPFYVDDDVVRVNTCELTFRLKPFRAYSRATRGGGAVVKSTTSGGGTTATSSSGGGTSRSTASGGSSTRTSSTAAAHRHLMFEGTGNTTDSPGYWRSFAAPGDRSGASGAGNVWLSALHDNIYTRSADGEHSHSVSIPAHSHEFTVPNHTHSVRIPNHSHEIEIPNHTHDVKHEIVELDSTPSEVTIRVDGNAVPHSAISGDRINLVNYMRKDSSGNIDRGRHEVTIQPDGLARVEADLILRVFIQSHLGGNY